MRKLKLLSYLDMIILYEPYYLYVCRNFYRRFGGFSLFGGTKIRNFSPSCSSLLRNPFVSFNIIQSPLSFSFYQVEIGNGGFGKSIFRPITALVLRCKFVDAFILNFIIILLLPLVDVLLYLVECRENCRLPGPDAYEPFKLSLYILEAALDT